MERRTRLVCSAILMAWPFASPGTTLSGALSGTYDASGNPYDVVGNVWVSAGDTATFGPGAIVSFQGYYNLTVAGTLNVNGTAGNPVYLAYYDLVPGGWQGIVVSSGGALAMSNTDVKFASTGVRFDAGSTGSVFGGLFRGNDSDGMVIFAQGNAVSVSGTTFDANSEPLYIGVDCWPILSGITVNMNHNFLNGVLLGSGTWNQPGTFAKLGCPYVMAGNFTFNGAPLIVNAGVVFKCDGANFVFSRIEASGTAADPVLFTSLRDDSVMGDTNADGGMSAPAPNNWGWLYINDTGSTLSYATFSYGNSNIVNGSATFTACNFISNGGTGLRFEYGSAGSVSGGLFQQNWNEGLAIWSAGTGVSVAGATFDANGMPVVVGADCFPLLSGLVVNTNHSSPNGVILNNSLLWTQSGTFTNAGCPYIIDSISFDAPVTLDPGVVFKAVTGTPVGLTSLDANGTVAQPVIFTSLADDSVLGDTNGNGPSAGQPGDWYGLWFYGAGSTVDGTIVSYATENTLVFGDAAFKDVTFLKNGTGLSFQYGTSGSVSGALFKENSTVGLAVFATGSGVSVDRATFDGNGMPVRLGTDCFPSLDRLDVKTNHLSAPNGVILDSGGWGQPGTFTKAGCPYVVSGNTSFSGAPVVLDPGAVFKMGPGFLPFSFEQLDANGIPTDPVIFTSLKDDAILGDTNGDGASAGSPGDWPGIELNSSGMAPPSAIDATHIRFANAGLTFPVYASGVVRSSAFLRCDAGIQVSYLSLPDLGSSNGGNHFLCNVTVDVSVDPANPGKVLAKGNWWGESPPDASQISGPVEYTPWLAVPSLGIPGLRVEKDPMWDWYIYLNWDDVLDGCGEYHVWRAESPTGPWEDISFWSQPWTLPTFTDNSGLSDVSYYYDIRSY